MSKKAQRIIKSIAFLLVLGVVLWQVQGVLTPKWDWTEEIERVSRSVGGVFLEPDNSLDVLWLGTSHMQFGLSPIAVYRNTGIRSYNLSTGGQPLLLGYYRLKSVLKHQKPKVVVLDVGNCFLSESMNKRAVRWLKLIDAMPFSEIASKLEMTRDIANMNEGMNAYEEMLNTAFPLLRYHDNYALTADALRDVNDGIPYYRKGHVLTSRMFAYKGGDAPTEIDEELLSKVRDNFTLNGEYMDMVKQLCDENGAELVLTKVPVKKPRPYSGYWSVEKHAVIAEAAEARGLTFIDLNYEDVGIDWKTDTMDKGCHLNEKGAQKVSVFLSDWLMSHYDFAPDSHPEWQAAWDRQAQMYDKELYYCGLQMEYDLESYMRQLLDGDYTVFVAVSNKAGEDWSKEDQALFEKLTGAQISLYKHRSDAYCLVSKNGQVLSEDCSGSRCQLEGTMPDGTYYTVTSKAGSKGYGWVTFNGEEMACDGSGIHFVVYDNGLKCVVDSVNFISSKEGLPGSKGNIDYRYSYRERLLDYERKLMR